MNVIIYKIRFNCINSFNLVFSFLISNFLYSLGKYFIMLTKYIFFTKMSYINIIYILLINTNVPRILLLILHKNGKIVCI